MKKRGEREREERREGRREGGRGRERLDSTPSIKMTF